MGVDAFIREAFNRKADGDHGLGCWLESVSVRLFLLVVVFFVFFLEGWSFFSPYRPTAIGHESNAFLAQTAYMVA